MFNKEMTPKLTISSDNSLMIEIEGANRNTLQMDKEEAGGEESKN